MTAASPAWTLERGDEPLVATAIHDGHELREEVARLTALSDAERLREEDPYTGGWTSSAKTRIIVNRSRFEVDLNRPRERSVYRKPADAWDLPLWRRELPEDVVGRSLEVYDAFYRMAHELLADLTGHFPFVVVLDLHSYNHRRDGSQASPADPEANPEVNVGTGSLDRERWAPVADRFIEDLRSYDFLGRRLDVRENVRFTGGRLSRWVHQTFPTSACALAVEFKKFFMDEWSGEVEPRTFEAVQAALASTRPGLMDSLAQLQSNG